MKAGVVLWVATLQFFVAETIAEAQWTLPYDRNTDYVSDLGAVTCTTTVCSPWHALMNSSFVLQGLLIAGGAWLLRSVVRSRAVTILLVLAGVGVALVGLAPQDTVYAVHYAGAALNFVAGNAALVAIAMTTRRSPGLVWAGRWAGLLGAAGLVALPFFLAGVTFGLGIGGLERLIAYPIPLALPVLAVAVLASSPPPRRSLENGDPRPQTFALL